MWVMAFVIYALPFGSFARAGDSWFPFDPFGEDDSKKPAAETSAPNPPGAQKPMLRPMDDQSQYEGDRAGEPGSTSVANPKDPTQKYGSPRSRGQETVMHDAVPVPVEKGDLMPVMAGDGSGLPLELWRGLDAAGVETLFSELEIPPRSPALHNLWKRLITSANAAPSGDNFDQRFEALRIEALYRSGLAKDAAASLARLPPQNSPLFATLAARNALAANQPAQACESVRQAAAFKGEMPKIIKTQAFLLQGYCAAAAKDAASAGLAADLAREEGSEATAGLETLDAISIGAKPKITMPKRITLIDYRLMELAGVAPGAALFDKFEPALLVALAEDPATEPDVKLAAGEAAARINAISPEDLAQIYRAFGAAEPVDGLLGANQQSSAPRRAALFKASEGEHTPMKKTRLIRALIDDCKRNGLAFQAMQMTAKTAEAINPQPEIVWFAETGAEIGLASGNTEMTRRWVALASAPNAAGDLGHWLALADIADQKMTPHGQYLTEVETLALHGRFTPDMLHRLATVLDALDYNVPIPLWDAASRTPQPNGGYLPETGVLSQLQDAAKKKEFGHTVLLAMKALGPNGAEGAHMIALGDSIRALKRAGLESDARRLGLEALLGAWPRTAIN